MFFLFHPFHLLL
jgi:hypothetical protein